MRHNFLTANQNTTLKKTKKWHNSSGMQSCTFEPAASCFMVDSTDDDFNWTTRTVRIYIHILKINSPFSTLAKFSYFFKSTIKQLAAGSNVQDCIPETKIKNFNFQFFFKTA
jgi:uncharacterized membrane protein